MRTGLVLLFCILLTSIFSFGQKNEDMLLVDNDVKVLTFEELKPYLSAQDDLVHVINFWATWCAPCIKELPYFQELHDQYPKKVKIVLVSLDFPKKIEDQLIPFIAKMNLTPEVVLLNDPNENQWIPKIDKNWSGALPATLIYNKGEKTFYEGSFSRETLFTEVEKKFKTTKS